MALWLAIALVQVSFSLAASHSKKSNVLAKEVNSAGELLRSSPKLPLPTDGDAATTDRKSFIDNFQNSTSEGSLQTDGESEADRFTEMNGESFWRYLKVNEVNITYSDRIENFQHPEMRTKVFWAVLVDFVFYMLLADAFARHKVWPAVIPEAEPADLGKWSSSLCSCFDDMTIFWWSLLCPPIQHADSMQMTGQLSFPCGTVFYGILWLCTIAYLPVSLVSLLCLLLIMTWCRQRNRKIFKLEGYGDFHCILADFFLVSCCMPCTISQEARHIQSAAIVGHEVVRVNEPLPHMAAPKLPALQESSVSRYSFKAAPKLPAG